MRLHKLALAVGLASALGADIASALGLGELKLNSTLNQPLNAEIKLLNVKDLSPDEILVNLASRDAFKRAGVDRLYFLTSLKFTIVLDNAAGPIVRVTTRKPVNEPYLNFLLKTQWPSGNLLREYTLLMDLPTFSDDGVRPIERAGTAVEASPSTATSVPAIPVQDSRTSRVQKSARRPKKSASTPIIPKHTPSPARARHAQVAQPGYGSDVYGPVQANDTLWEIALKVRADRSLSVQQTMLAIQRANPEAFINNNINLLRKGQVLRIPTRNDILSLTARQAIGQVSQQNIAWSGNADGRINTDVAADITGAQLDASARSGTRTEADRIAQGRVKLGVDTELSNGGLAAGSDGGEGEALENELAISLEELDKSHRKNSDLKSRVSELESQIETMERMVEVSSNDMRALQLSQQKAELAEAQAEANELNDIVIDLESDTDADIDTSIESDKDFDTATLELDLEGELDINDAGSDSDAAAEVAPVPVSKKPAVEVKKPKRKIVRRMPPKEKDLIELAMDNIAYVGAGILVLLAGLWALLRRRKDDDFDNFDDYDESGEQDILDDLGVDDTALDSATELLDLDALDEDSLTLDTAVGLDDDLPAIDELDVEAETGDVVGEVDIYIAYGKLDQAEQMLLKALQRDPKEAPVILKLLEVYSESQNIIGFDEYFGQLLAVGDENEQQRARELRDSFTDVPEYTGSSEALSDDLDALLEAEPAADSALSDTSLTVDSEFDLGAVGDDLSLELEGDLSSESEFEGLDFSLDSEAGAGSTDEPSSGVSGAGDTALLDELSIDLPDLDLDLELDDAVSDSLSGSLTDDDLGLSGLDTDLNLDLNADSDLSLELETGDELISDGDDELDLDLGMDLAADLELKPAAEDESFDLSFEEDLSSSDSGSDLSADLSVGKVTAPLDELDFDLSELDAEVELKPEPEPVAVVDAADLSLDADDDLSLDLGDGAVDLAALDQEMDDFDLDLDLSGAEMNVSEAPTELAELDGDNLQPESEKDIFEAAVPDVTDSDLEVDMNEFTPEGLIQESSDDEDMDTELDFLADTDEAATKLDLARAYVDMGDSEGAKDILNEVLEEGNDTQKSEAQELLGRID